MASSASSKLSKTWLQASWWPIILVTGGTVASFGVYGKRHAANNPEFNSPDSRSRDGLPNPEGSTAEEEGFGRKSARVTGMMEGDRPMQGIFPAKKMTKVMAPILPETEPTHELPPEKKK
ncbi:hypothetical protein Ndes2526B_g05403 [Nannochloris sp. 'desiccata']